MDCRAGVGIENERMLVWNQRPAKNRFGDGDEAQRLFFTYNRETKIAA